MTTKKHSTRSADSGWLLEVGVIGIDKTLKLIKLTRLSPIELEYCFRSWAHNELTFEEKMTLPFRKIKDKDYGEIADDYEFLAPSLEHDQETKKRKGGKRKALSQWLLNRKTFTIIKANGVGYQWKLFNRIKAESFILWDAFHVINGNLKSMPKSYSDKKIQMYYNKKNKSKVVQIIEESSVISNIRKSNLEQGLMKTRKALKEHNENLKEILKKHADQKRYLAFQIAVFDNRLKKWGKESQL
jgi:hypothetical protein